MVCRDSVKKVLDQLATLDQGSKPRKIDREKHPANSYAKNQEY